MIDGWDAVLRLGAATLIGAAIGLNRDLHGKPIGVRTLGLVGLCGALIVTTIIHTAADGQFLDGATRVMQGVLTGIGFLGAGVIIRGKIGGRVHGLTSAACTLVTVCLGLACGFAAWSVVGMGVVLVFLLLVFGGPVERRLHALMNHKTGAPPQIPRP